MKNRRSPAFSTLLIAAFSQTALAAKPPASAPLTVEERISRIAEQFKPIPDAEWSTIAGPKSAETYETVKGDTLYGISKRLFSDAKYWPKIWALNNSAILNPHRIKPGVKIAFLPGSGSSLPAVAIQPAEAPTATTASEAPASPANPPETAPAGSAPSPNPSQSPAPESSAGSPGPSAEWKNLPRQRWEVAGKKTSKEEIDQSLEVSRQTMLYLDRSINPSLLITEEKLEPLGEITGSREQGLYLTDDKSAFIEAEKSLTVDGTYTVLAANPIKIEHRRSDRSAYGYPVLGKVQIEGVRDGIYLGKIKGSRAPITRGAFIFADIPTMQIPTPIPAEKAVTGVVIPNPQTNGAITAQHHEVLIDRGTADGVKPGMVFRVHRHFDPFTGKKLTEADFLIEADILILTVSEEHSLGIVTQSHVPIDGGDEAILLTDISDVNFKLPQIRFKGGGTELENELDKLDQEGAGGLKKEEKKELEQLEEWKKNPPESTSETPPNTPADAPSTDATAPQTAPSDSPVDSVLDAPATEGAPPAEVPAGGAGSSAPPPAPAEAAPPVAPESLPAPPAEVPDSAADLIPPGGN